MTGLEQSKKLIEMINSKARNMTKEEKEYPLVAILAGDSAVIETIVAQAVIDSGIEIKRRSILMKVICPKANECKFEPKDLNPHCKEHEWDKTTCDKRLPICPICIEVKKEEKDNENQ